MTEHDQEMLDDVTGFGIQSNCCGAPVYEFGESTICKDCKEWCDAVKTE